MHKSLRSRILLLTIIPPVVISCILGIYFTLQRNNDLNHYTLNRGQTSILQLAVNIQNALLNNNSVLTQKILNGALEEHGVRAAGYYSTNGVQLIHAGASFTQKPSFNKTSDGVIVHRHGNTYLFSTPVYSTNFISQIDNIENIENSSQLLGWLTIEYSTNDIVLLHTRSEFILLFLLLITACITGAAAIKTSNYIIREIQYLTEKIKGLKEGRISHNPVKTASEEMTRLSNNIQELFEQIHNEHMDMKLEYEQVYFDEQNAKELLEIQNIELNEAKKEAIAASKSKSEFLANTSHEIRTPLNGIIGFSKLLGKTKLTSQQQEYIETIQDSSENLLAIINDILDFSKIEAGKLELELAPVNLRALLEECLNLFAPQAYEKNLEIILIIYQDVPEWIKADQLRLKQIISNLLSNAVKFTKQGSVVIRAALESIVDQEASISISVSDTGIGMTPQQQANIFNAFTQANSSISREYGGTGLGLAIVKKLASLMRGNIAVDSEIGQGSTFSFDLISSILPKAENDSATIDIHSSILLIEQHDLLRQSLKHTLSKCYQRIFICHSLTESANILSEHHIDLIIFGVNPALTDNENNRHIHELSQHQLPMILMLNNNQSDAIHTSTDIASIRLQKPVTSLNLFSGIDHLLKYKEVSNAPLPPPKHIGLTMLVVDDNHANNKLLSTLLMDKGISVVTADNGLKALEACQDQLFDMIFMDIQMPVMNGIQAAIAIRQQTINIQSPIIAATAHAMADEKAEILLSGMNDYLTKPIIDEQLDHLIKKYCPENSKNNIIDIPLCLKLANHKKDLAFEMFNLLCTSLPNDMENIAHSLSEKDDNTLLRLIHNLHGACCYTGVPELKDAAFAFENAIKEKQVDHYNEHFKTMYDCANNVIAWRKNNDVYVELNKS